MRLAAVAAIALLVAGCGGGHVKKSRPAAHADLSALQATADGPVRNGTSGAPVAGVTVTGTVTNTDGGTLRCRSTSFVLLGPDGTAVPPSSQWCDTLALAPGKSARFSATFPITQRGALRLRFLHPNGSYETHALTLPAS